MILRVLVALCLASAALSNAAEWVHWRATSTLGVNRGSSRATWPSLAQNDEHLEIRLSITTPSLTRSAWTEAELSGAQLSTFLGGELKQSWIASASFASRVRVSERGTAISIQTVTLTFPAGRKTWDLGLASALQLKLGNAEVLNFDVTQAASVTPFRWEEVKGSIPLGIEVRADRVNGAMFPMLLRSLRVVDHELELSLSFENAHRLAVEWRGTLNGGHLRLRTREGASMMPTMVSDSLRVTILPTGKFIESGAINEGTVRMPLPSEEEAEQFTVLLPGYRPATLVFDAPEKTWKTAKAGTSKEWTNADAALERERRFTEMRAFLNRTAQHATQGDTAAFTESFAPSLRDAAQRYIRGLKHAEVTDLQWELSPRSEIVIDRDSTKELDLVMNYRISGLGEANDFGLDAKIRVRRLSRTSWQITQLNYPLLTPFWTCGYTASERTEHFTVFHLPDSDGNKQAEATGKELESAYASLRGAGLKMRDRYLAFAITRADDFKTLTSRNPGTYSGVASMRQVFRDGRLRNINQAIFINDPRFSFLERLMRRQGHQQTVLHELTHLGFANASMPWTPAWLEEGLAMHYAKQLGREEVMDLRRLLTAGLSLKNMSLVPYLGYGTEQSPAAMQAQYYMSAATVKWLIDKFGVEAVIAFHRSFATDYQNEWKHRPTNDPDRLAVRRLEITRAQVKKHFSTTLESLDLAVKTGL